MSIFPMPQGRRNIRYLLYVVQFFGVTVDIGYNGPNPLFLQFQEGREDHDVMGHPLLLSR